MKRAITIQFILFTGLYLSSCVDELTSLGTGILPPEDRITVYTDTFQMKASTVRLDSIFAKTSDCLLGEMYDPVYGMIKADMICQFYCEEGLTFSFTPYNNKVDSVDILIYYPLNSSGGLIAYGDTLTPMEVTVYPVNKPLKRNFYTNDRPEEYCDMNNPLGSASYTLYDLTISDSIRSLTGYSPYVRVRLPAELGQKFYEETINNPSTFKNQNAFNEFFPGIYITNTYGSGCLLRTMSEYIAIQMYYTAAPDEAKPDSLVLMAKVFQVSKEVIQINRLKNSNIDQLLEDNPTHTYIKSPAGVCTKLVLPTTEISKSMDINDRYINGFTLNLKYLPEDEWRYAYAPPEHLLLLPEDSVTSFFEKELIENDSIFISYRASDSYGNYASPLFTSYGYSPYTRTYSFGNISRLLKSHIASSPDKDLSLLVVPVTRKTTYSGYGGSNYFYTTGISHNFNLAGAKIRTEDEFMKVIVVSSKHENREN